MKTCRQVLIIFLISPLMLITTAPVYSQNKGIEVANVYDLADPKASEGDIIVLNEKGLVRATAGYDRQLFGVIQSNPLAVYRDIEKTGVPILRNGTTPVKVTNLNGPIKSGDYVTSSELAGYGAVAVKSGYVLGIALSGFEGNSGNQIDYNGKKYNVGTVDIALKIEYAEITHARNPNRLINQINEALLRSLQTPEKTGQILRYLMALLVLFASLAVAYLANARTSARSIEAIGRNPVAKEEIKASARLNFFFSALIVTSGIVAAVLIIIL